MIGVIIRPHQSMIEAMHCMNSSTVIPTITSLRNEIINSMKLRARRRECGGQGMAASRHQQKRTPLARSIHAHRKRRQRRIARILSQPGNTAYQAPKNTPVGVNQFCSRKHAD
jgi:hypothetical protein